MLEFCRNLLLAKRVAMPETFPPEALATETGRIAYAKAHARRELLMQLAAGIDRVAKGASAEATIAALTNEETPRPAAAPGPADPSAGQ